MSYDSMTAVTDNLHDNLATYQNEKKTAIEHLMSAAAYASYVRTQSMTANVTLTDSDFPIQSFSPTAARDLTLPAVASSNHPFFVVNRSATYEITVKNASATVIGIVAQSTSLMVLSDGANGWYVPGDNRTMWEEVASTPATPSTGKWRVYFKSDGLYVVDDAGVATGPLGAGGGAGNGWTAGTGTWSYSSADSPTFVISVNNDQTAIIGVGQRIKLTQTTDKYFVVTAVGAYSGSATLITVYGGTDYTLANAAITTPYWSNIKAPFGFPGSPAKWTVTTSDTTSRVQASPVNGTYYNLGSVSISVPIGVWRVSYVVGFRGDASPAANVPAKVTLSTANNSESDADFSCYVVGNSTIVSGVVSKTKILTLASKTSYYINTAAQAAGLTNIFNQNDNTKLFLRAECAYL